MNPEQFWHLVERSISGTDIIEQLSKLEELLGEISDADSANAYKDLMHQCRRAERYKIISAAFCFAYQFSDSSWVNHKYWLVSRGKQEFELAITDPDSFYSRYYDEIKTENIFFEDFYSCFDEDLDRRGIDCIDIEIGPTPGFSGNPVEEDDWPTIFPKICNKKKQLGIDGWA